MSTSATYTFKGNDISFSVYKHHDNYPLGAYGFIKAAQESLKGYPFDAPVFCAAFMIENKGERRPGIERIDNPETYGTDYRYEISEVEGKINIVATCHKYDKENGYYMDEERNPIYEQIFNGSLEDFKNLEW